MMKFAEQWEDVPDTALFENGFRLQWEKFISHVVADTAWHHDLVEGAKGVQLAELALQSWAERRWIDVPALALAPVTTRAA
jgi:predicted dehydrogenase